ncbi:hypothetical protein [Leeuwenhoekiella sp. NPDC079379]|uniref:hypothetical protein n=1 Tax=Leeuwenhoekiella sp. NPDC079379 TaxID=3364122 RepID=UPI0037C50135
MVNLFQYKTKVAIIFMVLGFNLGFSQVELPFFEQIAFDFYKDTIIEKYSSNKKIRIAKYAVDLHPHYYRFQVDECLTREFLDEKTNLQILSSYAEKETDFDFYTKLMNYDVVDKKQFRIKNSKTESYPYLRISMPYYKKMSYISISLTSLNTIKNGVLSTFY